MKKNILIVGSRCSGKSIRLEQMKKEMSVNYVSPKDVIQHEFLLNYFEKVSNVQIECFCYDMGCSIEQLHAIANDCNAKGKNFIMVTGHDFNYIPHGLVSMCEVIHCKYGDWENHS